MRTERRKKFRLWIIGVVGLLFVTPLTFLLQDSLSPSPVLTEPPNEARRIHHPSGFSIVIPLKMKAEISKSDPAGPSAISVLPDGGRSRYTHAFGVEYLGINPDLKTWKGSETWQSWPFQNQSAIASQHAFGEYSIWETIFDRGEKTFRIHLLIPDGGESVGKMPPAEWLPYLNSFRVD